MKEYFEKIFSESEEEFHKLIENKIENSQKSFIVTANPETLMIAEENEEFKKSLLDENTIIVPDGIGVIKGMQMLKYKQSGTITGVEHFESACVSYKGNTVIDPNEPKWEQTNDQCLLVPDGIQGIKIADSSNGRDSNNSLVLRFSAGIALSPEVFKFSNTHMLALAPSGRHNVTDSYVQIQAMFGQRASDCQEGDTSCSSNSTSQTGEPEEQNIKPGEER